MSQELVVSSQGSNMSLSDFKEIVKKYMELDNWLKKAHEVSKEKKKQKAALSEVITKIMIENNIDDLNTTFGKIPCKVKQVKEPISQSKIKEKITDYYKENKEDANKLITVVFDKDRQMLEKTSLRRVKIT